MLSRGLRGDPGMKNGGENRWAGCKRDIIRPEVYHMDAYQVGDSAPDFALPDHEGNIYRLSELTAEKNVLLVFNLGLL